MHPALHSIGRAVRRRCPRCAGGPLFRDWFHLHPSCPDCGLLTDRGESDYFLGALLVNLVVSEVLVAVVVLVIILVSWPSPPWVVILYGGLALGVGVPVVFYPLSKTVWLAVDLQFQPGVDEKGRDWPGKI